MLAALVTAASPLAMAATAVVDVPASYFLPSSGRAVNEVHGNGMIGWTFSVTSATTITQIGWYDDGGDGLSRDFQVGLWRAQSGTFNTGDVAVPMLGAEGVVIPAGTGTSYNGLYRYIDLPTALVLQPGFYQIGGLDTATTSDPIKYFFGENLTPGPGGNSQSFNLPGLNYYSFFYTAQTSGDPTFRPVTSSEFYLATGLELGPMIFAIPEPSALMLAGAGGLLLLPRRRTRA